MIMKKKEKWKRKRLGQWNRRTKDIERREKMKEILKRKLMKKI